MARSPLRRGAQCSRIGWIGLRPALAIKSAGRRYTIPLLVNYTGNLELRPLCYSMLYPNNACRKHLVLSVYQR